MIFILFFAFNFSQLLINTSFRYRIISFYIFLLLCSIWGFYYSFEGFIFILLLSELLIILIFTLIYLTLQFSLASLIMSKKLVILLVSIFFLSCIFFSDLTGLLVVYEDLFDLRGLLFSDDFFIFFYFFFINYPLITSLVAFLLTIFSIFFIVFYLSIKIISYQRATGKKLLYLLRRQSLVHQSRYRACYQTFQK